MDAREIDVKGEITRKASRKEIIYQQQFFFFFW